MYILSTAMTAEVLDTMAERFERVVDRIAEAARISRTVLTS